MVFAIGNVHRPYDSVGTTVPSCDEVFIVRHYGLHFEEETSGA